MYVYLSQFTRERRLGNRTGKDTSNLNRIDNPSLSIVNVQKVYNRIAIRHVPATPISYLTSAKALKLCILPIIASLVFVACAMAFFACCAEITDPAPVF